MWLKKKEDDLFTPIDENDVNELDEADELTDDECSFETKDNICLLKKDGGKCDNENCIIWRIWMNC